MLRSDEPAFAGSMDLEQKSPDERIFARARFKSGSLKAATSSLIPPRCKNGVAQQVQAPPGSFLEPGSASRDRIEASGPLGLIVVYGLAQVGRVRGRFRSGDCDLSPGTLPR